jgi:bifunctional non-homologous end joining protein LigD
MDLPLVQPIHPVLSKALPEGAQWRYEPKLDGFRGLLYLDRGRAWFRSKSNRVMTRFRGLAEAIGSTFPYESAIFDGEIVVLRDGRPDFLALLRATERPEYAAFDLLWIGGQDYRPEPYTARKRALKRVLRRVPAVGLVEGHRDPGLFAAAVRLDLEGVVAKRASDPYAATTRWVKVKHAGYSQAEGRGDLFTRGR